MSAHSDHVSSPDTSEWPTTVGQNAGTKAGYMPPAMVARMASQAPAVNLSVEDLKAIADKAGFELVPKKAEIPESGE